MMLVSFLGTLVLRHAKFPDASKESLAAKAAPDAVRCAGGPHHRLGTGGFFARTALARAILFVKTAIAWAVVDAAAAATGRSFPLSCDNGYEESKRDQS